MANPARILSAIAVLLSPVVAAAQVFDMGSLTATLSTDHVTQVERERGVRSSPIGARATQQVRLSARAADAQRSTKTLSFRPSPANRQTNYAKFVERSRRADPAGAAGLAETLAADPIAQMGPELARFGLRTDNVADAYAVYWVEAWQAAHGLTGESSRATAQAVRRQAADALLATPEFARATDAQKQDFADALLVQALLIGAARSQAAGDSSTLEQIATAVRQGARASGLDLDAMTLTENGFVPAGKTGATAPAGEPEAQAAAGDGSPSYALLALMGGAGLGAAFLLGKSAGRKG